MNRRLDHETLEVYQASLTFITWLESILRGIPKSLAVADLLDRTSTSIPLKIDEGNGKTITITITRRPAKRRDAPRGPAQSRAMGMRSVNVLPVPG